MIILMAIALAPGPVDANHGRPYSRAVTNARQWSRDRLADRPWRCFDRLIHEESGWAIHARTGRAYGLPQALPGVKMKAAERPRRGPEWDSWRHDWHVQLTWAFRYIRGRYGSMCAAYRHQLVWGWY